ncbi:MAG: hypothetical protein NTU50_01940 [Actinobacteria bacterium]|nr:hypothetical protein [Actinomycetota bacterium]
MTIINNARSLEVVGAPAIDPAVLEDARTLGIAPNSVLATEVLDGGRGRRTWRVRTASADFVLRRRQFLGDEDVATTVAEHSWSTCHRGSFWYGAVDDARGLFGNDQRT